jgi:hypothetical protein
MLGFYENFPQTIHRTEIFTSALARSKLQQKIVRALQEINCETFCFEEVGNPTIPGGTVNFEFGVADTGGFCYLNEEEAKHLLEAVEENPLHVLDWFCGIRYYKNAEGKKSPLRFDYYLMRIGFNPKGALAMSVSHERGPRYVSPEDLLAFVVRRINGKEPKKTLKHTN